MAFTKLSSLAIRLTRRKLLLQRLTAHKSKSLLILSNDKSTLAAKKEEEEDDLDSPLVYSTSKAATWDPVQTRIGTTESIPWFQPFWVLGSIGAILIYFCILREENDIDEKLSWDLTDHFNDEAKAKLETSQRIPLQYTRQRNYTMTKTDLS